MVNIFFITTNINFEIMIIKLLTNNENFEGLRYSTKDCALP